MAELAQALGVDRSYITHLENGSKRRVSPEFYASLCRELLVDDTRALLASYSGRLYQVRRGSDNTTRDITVLAPGGTAGSGAPGAVGVPAGSPATTRKRSRLTETRRRSQRSRPGPRPA